MADDDQKSNPFASLIGALQNKKGEKGTVRSDKDGKISPSLTSNETARYTNIFGIMKKVLSPNEEAERLSKKSSTTAKVGKTATAAIGATTNNLNTSSLSSLMGPLTLAYLYSELNEALPPEVRTKISGSLRGLLAFPAIGRAVSGLMKVFSLVGKGISAIGRLTGLSKLAKPGGALAKTVGSIGKIGGGFMKILAGGGKLVAKLKILPVIGSFFNFAMAITEFRAGRIGRGLLELATGVIGLIPGIGQVAGPILNGAMLAYDLFSSNESGKDLREMLGDPGKRIKEFFEPIVDAVGEIFTSIGEWITNTFTELEKFLKDRINEKFKQSANAINTVAGKEVINPDADAGGTAMSAAKTTGTIVKFGLNPTGAALEFAARYFQKEKVDDGFISKNGRVIRFNDQDDILAAKKGGPIERMLDGNSAIMRNIAGINSQQLSVLESIREGIVAIAEGSVSISDSSGDNQSNNTPLNFSPDTLTQQYYA